MIQLLLFNITNGLIIGASHVLMALGLSLILNLTNVVNFAHGGFLLLGGYFAYNAYAVSRLLGRTASRPTAQCHDRPDARARMSIRPLYGRDP
jgi:branched-chain amino acid transport system permease protein